MMDGDEFRLPAPSLWALRDDKTAYRVDDFNAEWIASQRYRQVGLTHIGAHAVVSTVFLGVGIGPSREPYLFETMVFIDGRDGPIDEARHRTYAAAEAGHAALAVKWQVIIRA
jgi:hypothetical protein